MRCQLKNLTCRKSPVYGILWTCAEKSPKSGNAFRCIHGRVEDSDSFLSSSSSGFRFSAFLVAVLQAWGGKGPRSCMRSMRGLHRVEGCNSLHELQSMFPHYVINGHYIYIYIRDYTKKSKRPPYPLLINSL